MGSFCCCFGVRHGQLLLGFFTFFCLFANLNLIHLTSVLHPSTPDGIRAFESLRSIHPARLKRAISASPTNVTKWDDGHPIPNDEDGKGPIPVEIVTTTVKPTTTSRTTFLFTNPSTTPTTTTEAKTTPSMKWPETTTEEEEREDDDVTPILKDERSADLDDEKKVSRAFSLDTLLRLLFFSCAGIGMLLTSTSLLFLPTTINPRVPAAIALALSALVTAWQPFMNYYGAAVARIIQGAMIPLALPLMRSLVTSWAPIHSRAFHLSFLLLSYPLSIQGPWPLTQLISDFELPYFSIFIIMAVLSVIVAIFVGWRFKEHPYKHASIGGTELNEIVAFQGKEEKAVLRSVPNHRSTSFWIVTIALIGFFTAQVTMSFYLPTLLACPELMWMWNLGVTAALPFGPFALFFFIFSLFPYSPLSTRIMNTIALIGTGIAIFLIPYLIDPESIGNVLLLTLLLPLSLFSAGAVHLAVHHSSIRLIPSICLALSAAHLIAPSIVHFMVDENQLKFEWIGVFSTVGGIAALCCAPFLIFAKPTLFPKKKQTTLRTIDDDEECGLQELQELPPAGHYLK